MFFLMSRMLVMKFLNEEGKKSSITINNIKDNIDAKKVSEVMDIIINKNIFFSKGGDLKMKDSAFIIDKEEKKIDVK